MEYVKSRPGIPMPGAESGWWSGNGDESTANLKGVSS